MSYHVLYNHLKFVIGVIFVWLLNGVSLSAQPVSFQNWNAENGLSQNTVYAIGQDNDGFIWLGTRNGLNRFDGREFRVFRNIAEGLQETADYDITSLFSDNDNILTGTSRGLIVFNRQTETFQKI